MYSGLKKSNWCFFAVLIVSFGLRAGGGATANLSYAVLSAYALFGRAQAIHALIFSWFITMINNGLVPEANGLGAGRYLVILAAAVSVGSRALKAGSFNVKKLSFYTLAFSTFLLAHSLFFSFSVDVSVLKILAWALVVLTLLSAWQSMPANEHALVFKQIENFLLVLMLISVPLLALPAIGYLRNEVGFQGILNHPQAFGPTAALLAAMIAGRALSTRQPRWIDVFLVFFCFTLVFLSGARTAGLAVIFGLVSAVVFCPIFAGISRADLAPALKSGRTKFVMGLGLLLVITAGPQIVPQVKGYLFKQSDVSNLIDAAEASRGDLIQKMLSNIQQRPLTGIGFGIASNPAEMEVERDGLFGLPLSAIVEKGVMPIALIEELGFIGALIALAWVMLMLRRGATAGIQKFTILVTLLLVNFGESMLFSVGGMGLLLLILMTAAIRGKVI